MKQHLGMFDRHLLVTGENQPVMVQVFPYQIGEAGFEDVHLSLAQLFDLDLIDVHAHDVVADFGKHGCLYQTYISATENADFHGKNPEERCERRAEG